jgi:hypothetical protein
MTPLLGGGILSGVVNLTISALEIVASMPFPIPIAIFI